MVNIKAKGGQKIVDIKKIKTLGDLKASDYKPKTIKEEMRDNLILKM